MTSTRTHVRVISAVLALLGSFVVAQLALPTAAHARCDGVNVEKSSNLIVNNVVWVYENPVDGTCNKNNFYQSHFRSTKNNWRASVWIQNNNLWTGHFGGYDLNTYYLSYWDDNSHSGIHFCLDNGDDWYCGWGHNYTKTSGPSHANWILNHGF